jgi:hypothetical protein
MKWPEPPENGGHEDALAVQTYEQVRQGIQLGLLKHGEEIGAAHEDQRGARDPST